MSLGDRLRAQQAQQAEEAQRVSLQQKAERDEELFLKVIRLEQFFDYSFRLFEHRLLNGKAPGHIQLGHKTFRELATCLNTYNWSIPYAPGTDWRREGVGIWTKSNQFYSLWEAFEQRCAAAGLAPQWSPAHDGAGVESWFELTVTPL